MEDEDKTIIMSKNRRTASPVIEPVTIRYTDEQGVEQVRHFTSAIVIGRDASCDVRLSDDTVSRHHLEVVPRNGSWWVYDLNSSNGTFLDGNFVQEYLVVGATHLRLGRDGPFVWLETLKQEKKQPQLTCTAQRSISDVSRYVDPGYSGPMGEHTLMVRQALKQAKQKQSKNYLYVIGFIGMILAGAIGYAVYQQFRLEKLESLTIDIFYNMKELELQVANLENITKTTGNTGQEAELSDMRNQLSAMESRYDTYRDKVGLFRHGMSEEDRLIFKVARIFGECEINVPRGFAKEVKAYIAKWQSSNRLATAIERAQVNGYTPIVKDALSQNYLPSQFFYLALQESNYERGIIGPQTYAGIAKGIWQFIPTTAKRYGLSVGPLSEVRLYDPKDDRFDFKKATFAAADYLRDIYTTEAQASGLLVMASYNWGENRVRKLIRKMPENPRQRNFWELIKKHNIPKETYNYVYYIFSAAVIGENPKLFGFDFENPLKSTKTIVDSIEKKAIERM